MKNWKFKFQQLLEQIPKRPFWFHFHFQFYYLLFQSISNTKHAHYLQVAKSIWAGSARTLLTIQLNCKRIHRNNHYFLTERAAKYVMINRFQHKFQMRFFAKKEHKHYYNILICFYTSTLEIVLAWRVSIEVWMQLGSWESTKETFDKNEAKTSASVASRISIHNCAQGCLRCSEGV